LTHCTSPKFHEFNIRTYYTRSAILLQHHYRTHFVVWRLWLYIVLLKCLAWRGFSLPWQICGFRVDTGEGKIGKRHCAYVCYNYFPLQLSAQFSCTKRAIDKKKKKYNSANIYIFGSLGDNTNIYIYIYIHSTYIVLHLYICTPR